MTIIKKTKDLWVNKKKILTDKEIISNLFEGFRVFKKETSKIISDLRKEVSELKEKLSKYENPKNSKNSNTPSSQDSKQKDKKS